MVADSNIQALSALRTEMAVTANNIANVSTQGFNPSRTHLETGPGGQGVRISAIQEEAIQGPFVPASGGPAPSSPANTPPANMPMFVEGSGTDMIRETVAMMQTENAYAANAVAIRTQDELAGTLLDLMV